jgi:hypothetical protein
VLIDGERLTNLMMDYGVGVVHYMQQLKAMCRTTSRASGSSRTRRCGSPSNAFPARPFSRPPPATYHLVLSRSAEASSWLFVRLRLVASLPAAC